MDMDKIPVLECQSGEKKHDTWCQPSKWRTKESGKRLHGREKQKANLWVSGRRWTRTNGRVECIIRSSLPSALRILEEVCSSVQLCISLLLVQLDLFRSIQTWSSDSRRWWVHSALQRSRRPQNQMHPTIRADNIAHLPNFQAISSILERFLHLATSKKS